MANYHTSRRIFFDLETQGNPENIALMPEPVVTAPANYKDHEKIREYIERETAAKKAELINRAALDPDYGKILSIGLSYGEFISVWVVGEPFGPDDEPLTEVDLLEMFWQHFADCRGKCVGFNILGFDLPYLLRRSMALGVKPLWLPDLRRYQNDPVCDLMAILYNWGAERYKGLKQVARLYGIENNCPDVDGAMVRDLDAETLRAYQASDVKLVIELYRRMNGVYFRH